MPLPVFFSPAEPVTLPPKLIRGAAVLHVDGASARTERESAGGRNAPAGIAQSAAVGQRKVAFAEVEEFPASAMVETLIVAALTLNDPPNELLPLRISLPLPATSRFG